MFWDSHLHNYSKFSIQIMINLTIIHRGLNFCPVTRLSKIDKSHLTGQKHLFSLEQVWDIIVAANVSQDLDLNVQRFRNSTEVYLFWCFASPSSRKISASCWLFDKNGFCLSILSLSWLWLRVLCVTRKEINFEMSIKEGFLLTDKIKWIS